MCTHQAMATPTRADLLLRRTARMICALVMGLALVLGASTVAQADDASLLLRMSYTSKGVTRYIDGVEVTLYQVATLDDNINFYTTLDPFASLGVDFNEGFDANSAQKVADKAAGIVEKKKVKGAKTAISTKQGTISFGTLPWGVYLVKQTGATGTAKSYYDFDPFLISVPSLEEERIVYNVVADPKTSPRPEVKPPAEKKPLPKTGDMAQTSPWLAFLIGGAVLLTWGLILRRKTRPRP